jgi:succinate dehydrogenase/fumarate reductase flavoprotein subunit
MNRLSEQVRARPNVSVLEECRAVELLLDGGGRAAGALVLGIRSGELIAVAARATLLAMGGGPTMYKVIACSADKSADGLALAWRAGLELRDMEMVQFHPTGLVIPGSLMTGALLEEGLRGAGGYLRNGRGERFMQRYDPARMERSTRDLVSRASFTEIAEDRGTPNGGVWIDVSHLGAEHVEREFRGMVRRCRDFGRDLARGPVEVQPTTHFMMGGVVTDSSCRTMIEGLFVAGEDAGGVHGANRLGGNGVAESTVFGGIAGDVMADFVAGQPVAPIDESAFERTARGVNAPRGRPSGADLYALQRELRTLMWDRAGLVRDAAGLCEARAGVDRIAAALEHVSVPGHGSFNVAWQDWLNLTNQVTVAALIVASALERTESRGAHYRSDFPSPDPGPIFTVRVRQRRGDPVVLRVPVDFTRMTPPAKMPIAVPVDMGD